MQLSNDCKSKLAFALAKGNGDAAHRNQLDVTLILKPTVRKITIPMATKKFQKTKKIINVIIAPSDCEGNSIKLLCHFSFINPSVLHQMYETFMTLLV